MSNDDSLMDTIVPKSDQLNADDLITGPLTITIVKVRKVSEEQPVIVEIEGRTKTPYKPCKGMRRVMILAWGDNRHEWSGRQMTLYRNPDVRFGGEKVGGIEISHMSHLDEASKTFPITATRGKKRQFTVRRLDVAKDASRPPATGSKEQQIKALLARLAKHIQGEEALDDYLVNTLGVIDDRTKGSSWSREAYQTAVKFCDEMEGPIN